MNSKRFRFISVIFSLLLFFVQARGAIVAGLTIENQTVVGTDFFFDIYLHRDASSTDDIYLSTSDFVLTFNVGNFNNPTLTKVSGGNGVTGLCTFVPTQGDPTTCRAMYYFTTSPVVDASGGILRINLNQPVSPSIQDDFDTGVAKIDGSPSTHRLGRFKISGITNPNGSAGLQWKIDGSGLNTKITVFQSVSPWTITEISYVATNPPNAPLPLELTRFEAKPAGASIQLDWESDQETALSGYEVQRSAGQASFKPISWVDARGGSFLQSYSYLDADVRRNTTYYYRLKMLDNDGRFEYSPVRSALIAGQTAFRMFPNPATEVLNIELTAPEQSAASLEVWDLAGRKVYHRTLGLLEGANPVPLPVAGWPEGPYFLKIIMGDKVLTSEFLKSN